MRIDRNMETEGIAMIGAGAIGCLVAAYLKLQNLPVTLIGRADSVQAIEKNGVRVSGVRGDVSVPLDASIRLRRKPGLAILCVKTLDVERALRDHLEFIQDSVVLTVQNGIRADRLAARYIPQENIVSSIVMFGATCQAPGQIVHNFEGSWILGNVFQGVSRETTGSIGSVLGKAFAVVASDDVEGMKYLKIFVNANNCIAAILGTSLQEAFADVDTSRVGAAIWKEGYAIVSSLGLPLVSLPDFPLDNLVKLVSLPTGEAARILSGIMSNLSQYPVYGSILQSIQRGRASEIDYLNGEFVALAQANGLAAPLNARLVQLVHQVEATKRFLTRPELLERVEEFII